MDLQDQKQKMKRKKPVFKRQDGHKNKKISRSGWRKPRGLHSKMREQRRGYRVLVKPGYGTPNVLKGLNKDGKQEILVHNIKELIQTPKGALLVIASGVGIRTKLAMVEEAKKQGKQFANLDVAEFTKTLEKKKQEVQKKKAIVEEKKKKRDKQIKEAEKANEAEKTKEAEKEILTDEEKKKQEKLEKDKLLTQKDTAF